MNKYLFFILSFFISTIAVADEQKLNVQAQLQSEYGNCYDKFQNNLSICNPSTCNYPDLSDAKAWRAHIIRGPVDDKCYVIYYSYVDSDIIGNPIHCYYDKTQVESVSSLYNQLFKTEAIAQATDIRGKLNEVMYNRCKTKNSKLDSSGSEDQ